MRFLVIISVGLLLPALLAGPRAVEERPVFWQVVERVVEKHQVGEPFGVVLDHLAGIVNRRVGVAHRIERVERALTQPWTPPELAGELLDLLRAPLASREGVELGSLWAELAAYIDLELPDPAEQGVLEELDLLLEQLQNPGLEGLELLEALSVFLGEANAAAGEGIWALSEAERTTLFETHAAFREAWYRSHFPGEELSGEQNARIGEWITLLRGAEFDHAMLLAVAARVSRLGDLEFRRSLLKRLRNVRTRAEAEGFDGDVRAVVGDRIGNRVVLGGKRETTYSAPAALVIDLGGDDVYERAAVVDDPDCLVSVVIDLKGNDTYRGVPGPATAIGGVAMLVDAKGDDHYAGGRLGQAAATFGVASLIDLEGDDRYEMEDFGQGHALAGTALLYDREGDDRYDAWAFAQGGGLGYGFSALVDGEGDDRYLADLHWPDVYGNSGPNIFHGASQGYCTGIRSGGGVAGGVAALVDLGDGADRYQSGNFSQGGAYFFSFALMYDDGGDDENFGTRYSQGFGVHQAAAVRWDHGGDDRYTCRSVAHTGMAWDEGVGYFLEDAGDDTYVCGGLALGGAAQTGVAICIDRGGEDDYQSGNASQGGTGSSEYHDKPSLGVLIDLGGEEDRYSAEGREDNVSRATPGVEVFLDTKAKTLEKALRGL